jgi:hypothetical protein
MKLATYSHMRCIWLACHVYRDEIQRIKASNPDITHREAFSAAAKNVTSLLLTSLSSALII